jgi:hypothetical protein
VKGELSYIFASIQNSEFDLVIMWTTLTTKMNITKVYTELLDLEIGHNIAIRFQMVGRGTFRWYVGVITQISHLRIGQGNDGHYRSCSIRFLDGSEMEYVLYSSNYLVKERGAWVPFKNPNTTDDPFCDTQIFTHRVYQ